MSVSLEIDLVLCGQRWYLVNGLSVCSLSCRPRFDSWRSLFQKFFGSTIYTNVLTLAVAFLYLCHFLNNMFTQLTLILLSSSLVLWNTYKLNNRSFSISFTVYRNGPRYQNSIPLLSGDSCSRIEKHCGMDVFILIRDEGSYWPPGKLDCLSTKKRHFQLINGRFLTRFWGVPILSLPLLLLTISTLVAFCLAFNILQLLDEPNNKPRKAPKVRLSAIFSTFHSQWRQT